MKSFMSKVHSQGAQSSNISAGKGAHAENKEEQLKN